MADDDDDEIGGQVVSAVRREIEPAHRAVIVDLEIGAKQLALAAAWATAAKAALDRRPDVALLGHAGFAGPNLGGRGGDRRHAFHDLPRFDFPVFFSGLFLAFLALCFFFFSNFSWRFLSRGLRPGRLGPRPNRS